MKDSDFFLGVNTVGLQGQVCLFTKTSSYELHWYKKGSHSERITEAFQQLLLTAKIKPQQISKIFCVSGPGSFTGIRVGVSFTKSLAFSLNIPIVPLSSLDLLSLNCLQSEYPILSVLDAQKNTFYISEYNLSNGKMIKTNKLQIFNFSSISKLFENPKFVCGDGFDKVISLVEPKIRKNMIFIKDSSQVDLLKYFKNQDYISAKEISWQELKPFYIKLSAPEEKLNPTFTN
jgi:tRNA threonylcarbamoyladenosine biosynthesis protein TsaB